MDRYYTSISSREFQPERQFPDFSAPHYWLTEAHSLHWKKVRDYPIPMLPFTTKAIQLSPRSAVRDLKPNGLGRPVLQRIHNSNTRSAREVALSQPKKITGQIYILGDFSRGNLKSKDVSITLMENPKWEISGSNWME